VREREYRCVATSRAGFIQQLAVSYIANGYFFYVIGSVPERKDPAAVDRKLIDRYGVNVSKWSRVRRKRAGAARVQYLRYGRDFALIATPGEHRFFVDEAAVIRDVRREPVKIFGYAVSHRRGHVHVRIEREAFKRLRADFGARALGERCESLATDLRQLPFEPYAPIRRQLLRILAVINRRRRMGGLACVPLEALRLRRRIVKPFDLVGERALFGSERPGGTASGGRRVPGRRGRVLPGAGGESVSR
jgi:hypothetical protein